LFSEFYQLIDASSLLQTLGLAKEQMGDDLPDVDLEFPPPPHLTEIDELASQISTSKDQAKISRFFTERDEGRHLNQESNGNFQTKSAPDFNSSESKVTHHKLSFFSVVLM
jgi:hypothetical protein